MWKSIEMKPELKSEEESETEKKIINLPLKSKLDLNKINNISDNGNSYLERQK